MAQIAYNDSRWDFSMFEESPEEKKRKEEKAKVKLKMIKGRKAENIAKFGKLGIALCVFYLVFFGLFIHEKYVRDDINRTYEKYNTQLEALQDENIQLNSQIESKFSLKDVEQYAINELGMVKIAPGQIEYINMSVGDRVVLHQ